MNHSETKIKSNDNGGALQNNRVIDTKEREYHDKLSEIFRTKNEKAKTAIMGTIDALLQAPSVSAIAAHERHIMPSIKKIIGKDEIEVTLEGVYNKLLGICEA
jgi:hypothetical protein